MTEVNGSINRVAFHLFGWPVHWYGIIIGLGMLIGYFLFTREARRKGIDSDTSFDLLFWTIIFGLIGARLYYVLFTLEDYLQDPLRIIFVWEGGMAIYGGVIAGALTLYYLCRKYQLSLVTVLDAAAPALMAGQSIGRWGNFINQEAHGGAVSRQFLETLNLPDFIINHMYINGSYYHPTFLYESLWNLTGLILILFLRTRPKLMKRGEITAFYLVWYGTGRFWIEGLRTDSLYLGPLRVSQAVSVLLVLAGIGLIIYIRKQQLPPIPYYTEDRMGQDEMEGLSK